MLRHVLVLSMLSLVFIVSSLDVTSAQGPEQAVPISSQSDDDIRDILIRRSLAGYSGNCPCPYNRASNGSRCGKRSAYSRPGGASPLCYPSDVSDAMIQRYRASVAR